MIGIYVVVELLLVDAVIFCWLMLLLVLLLILLVDVDEANNRCC